MHHKLNLSMTRGFPLVAVLGSLAACSASSNEGDPSSGGANASVGSGGAGTSSGGASSATAGSSPMAGAATAGAPGASGSAASIGGAGSGGAADSAGGSPSAGTGSGGKTGTAGSAGTGAAGSGMAGGAAGGSAGSAGSGSVTPPTGENSVAYIGCSMANNIGVGYKRVGGKVMWNADSYQTGAMVVQNWTDTNSASWKLFDQKMTSNGGKDKVKAIMVQICIFSSRATDAELKSMVASARNHVNPGTHIYMVGQPQYEAGHECSLAGNGGAKWTDDQAKAMVADPSVNRDMTYLGQFKLDSSKGEVLSDSCHASSPSGENVLGDQAKAFFGG